MPARKRRTTVAKVRARALVAPGIRALLGHPQPVAGAPGEADSLRSRFRDRLARIPERQLRPATVGDESPTAEGVSHVPEHL